MSRISKHRPPRFSLMSLHDRHHDAVRVMAGGYHTLEEIRAYLLRRYSYHFGRLRSRASKPVPSDKLRKEIIVERVIRLVQERRDELAREYRSTNRPIYFAINPPGCTVG